jgi:hypothetical protein
VSYDTHLLRLDADGNLWLTEGDGEDAQARLLGAPCVELYHEVPQALWPQLDGLILEREDMERYARECRAEALKTYWRNAL